MGAIASQLIITESGEMLRNSIVTYNANLQTIEYAGIFDGIHERANTVYYDGVISPPIVSLALFKVACSEKCMFEYIDLIACPNPILNPAQKYIFDIHSQNPVDLAAFLSENYSLFLNFSIAHLIAAFTSFPAQVMPNLPSNTRLLWQNIDLVEKKITPITKIKVINSF